MIDRRTLLATPLAAAAVARVAPAATTEWPLPGGIRVWPGPPPGARLPTPTLDYVVKGTAPNVDGQLRGIAVPMLFPIRPAVANGAALLIVPGGGYEFEAVTREGVDVARRFAAMGYTAYILTYRLPGDGWMHREDVPLQDAQRALRLIRAGAAADRIDPHRIGVMGFSAGGHLAATLTTAADEPVYTATDAKDSLSARPDFTALLYAVTTLRAPDTHVGSREHLLGPAPSERVVDRRSPVLHIDAQTPPTFLVHALDDTVVPPQNGIDWLQSCRAHRVPVEAHFPQHGGHGFGVSLPSSEPAALWPTSFARWEAALPRS